MNALRLPGGTLFGGAKKLAPLPPLPTREDPSIAEAREKLRLSEKKRKGIGSTILTGGLGDTTEALVTRPTLGG